jgi:cytochrome c-type biogenesis protein CcmF
MCRRRGSPTYTAGSPAFRIWSEVAGCTAGDRSLWSRLRMRNGAATIGSGLYCSPKTGDFRFAYVAEHSNNALPCSTKFAAWWGGQEGSLLFWSWLLSTYAAVVAFTNRRRHRDMMPWVLAILTTIQIFFLILNNFVANPFQDAGVEG